MLMLRYVEKERLLELNELDELRLNTYENGKLYKERTKLWNDRHILAKHVKLGHQENISLDSLDLIHASPHGAIEIKNEKIGNQFKVNSQRLKHYHRGDVTHHILSFLSTST